MRPSRAHSLGHGNQDAEGEEDGDADRNDDRDLGLGGHRFESRLSIKPLCT
jgi:hypothetical protein